MALYPPLRRGETETFPAPLAHMSPQLRLHSSHVRDQDGFCFLRSRIEMMDVDVYAILEVIFECGVGN